MYFQVTCVKGGGEERGVLGVVIYYQAYVKEHIRIKEQGPYTSGDLYIYTLQSASVCVV